MKNYGNVSEIAIFAHNIRVSWPSLYYRSHVRTFDHFRHLYLSGNGPVAFVSIAQAVSLLRQRLCPSPTCPRHVSERKFEKTIKAAVATAIEAMLPQLDASIAAENDRLTKEVGHLRAALQSQAFELDRLAQYSRRENVRLHGVPETADENTNDVVIAIASDMGVRINEHDICVSHRLQKSRSMQERPIIVRFVRRDTKIEIMRKKKTLRTIDSHRNTFINDDLRVGAGRK